MDMTHSVTKEQGRSSAVVTLAVQRGAHRRALGAKLFGLY
jgi:succinate dehydrogenase / fumarate reductase cytochrome b subunit